MGAKQIETRSWDTSHRGVIAIHASKGFQPWQVALSTTDPFYEALNGINLPLGAIIGVVDVVSTWSTDLIVNMPISDIERQFGDFTPGRFAWVLEEAVALPAPIPCQGMLGLWEVPKIIEYEIESMMLAI